VRTLWQLQQDVPDEILGDFLTLLLGPLDEGGQVAALCVLHEEVEVIFSAVEHARDELDDVGVVQAGQDSDLVGGVIAFVFAHAEAADLRGMGDTFFTAIF